MFSAAASSFNTAIRTLVREGGRLSYRVGAGIVADSDPDDEVAESLDKAVAFLAAVGATHTAGRPSVRTPA